MTDALLTWVRQGGTLICEGVPGVWTPYGEDDLRLVNQVFGKSHVSDVSRGKWHWKWKLLERSKAVESLSADVNGDVSTASARFGKGWVLIASNGFDSTADKQQFYRVLDAAIGKRPAVSAHDKF